MTAIDSNPSPVTSALLRSRRERRHNCTLARLLTPALMVAAVGCGEIPESPTAPAEPGGPVFDHTAGHKVVNSLADPGNGICNAAQCTLREAINDPGSTEISFAPGLTGTITLARSGLGGGTLVIEKNLSITGPSTGIVIRRRSTDPDFRIFRIHSGETVKLTNLTIRNGKMDQPTGGGGIINFGTLELINCTVAGNSATQGGGGISNRGGTLRLTNSTVAGNSARFGAGGGISNRGGTLAVTNSRIAGNSAGTAGGINSRFGTLTLTNSTVADNSGSGGAGGIGTLFARVTLTNSTVARNSGQRGGGIFNFASTLTITKSTVAGNLAIENGGGILNGIGDITHRAPLTLTNSTVSGNSARFGGGIVNTGFGGPQGLVTVTLLNSTVTRNSATEAGGGVRQQGEDAVELTNSLVARNSAPTGPDVHRESETLPVLARFSLIGDGSGSGLSDGVNGNQVGTASAPIDPKLGLLANNGGSTRTHALLLGSPAIDAGSTPDCPTTDQRGVLRPQGAACDIGSYERAE